MVAIYFLLQAIVATAIPLLVRTLPASATQALAAIVSLIIAAPSVMWLIHRKWQAWWSRSAPPGLGFATAQPRFLAAAVIAGLLAPLLGGLLTHWLAQNHPVPQDIRQLGGQASIGWRLPLALVAVAVGPLVEETLFRGTLLSALMPRWGTGWAVTLSSLLFALVHLPGLQFHLYALPALTLLALTLAWLRLHSGSIWPPVLAHASNNLLAVIVWFVAPGVG